MQAWRIGTLERIQKRATKIISELRYLSCEQRIKCGWFNNSTDKEVKRRLNRSFKILNGYENIDKKDR